MLRIGLTGGMGSGKSTVAKVFGVLGVPVYSADEAARRLMNEDPDLRRQIKGHFGEASFFEDRLNRPYMAKLVFNNSEKLKLLNFLVHPLTILDGEKWMEKQTTPYAIKEAALIFESGAQKGLDHVIAVFAPYPLRLARILKRDGISEEQAQDRIKNQMDEDSKMSRSDFLIYNDELRPVLPQVMELHVKLLELAKK